MNLRPYQEQALHAILAEWAKGVRRTLLVLPTGTGKTIVFSKVIEACVHRGQHVLVLAHRAELLYQALDKLARSTGISAAMEIGNITSRQSDSRVVVASVQSMMQEKRLERFAESHFGTIIIDEAHHAISESYQRILKHFATANVLGVTATADRGDMKNLGSYFESKAFEYSLPKAIKDGYLSPMKALTLPIRMDMTGVRTSAGDYSAADVGHVLEPYLDGIADEMASHCKGRKTVVFLPLIDTSRKMCDKLTDRGLAAVEVNGNSADRSEVLAGFERGDHDILCNSMLLTEGWDCPSVDCVVVLRPTKIRSLYAQMIGRGTRLHPGKDHLLILDFLWHTDRHELCRPASLICSNPEVAGKMSDEIDDLGMAMDIEEAMENAERDIIAEREESLARQLAEMRSRKSKLVDPLQYEMSIQAEDLVDYMPSFAWEYSPPSEKQIATLEKFGISTGAIENAGKASKLLDRLFKRREAGLATPKQIRTLENRGFLRVGTWSFEQASSMIGQLAENSWKIPRGIRPATYNPQAEKQADAIPHGFAKYNTATTHVEKRGPHYGIFNNATGLNVTREIAGTSGMWLPQHSA